MNKGLTNSVVENPYVARIEELTQELSRLQSERDEARAKSDLIEAAAREQEDNIAALESRLAEEKAARKCDRDWINNAVVSCAKRRCSTMQRDRDDAEQRAEAAESLVASLRARIEAGEKALRELVRLKDMKEARESHGCPPKCTMHGWDRAEYERCKPLAWQAARALLGEKQNG